MNLPPPPWGQEALPAGPNGSANGLQALVNSLTQQRLSRELGLALRRGIRDAGAEFSYVRLQGLNILESTIASSSSSDDCLTLFQSSQAYRDLQIVPVLFEHTLCAPKRLPSPSGDPITCDPPPRVVCPPSEEEIVAALRVLEGSCLIDPNSRVLAAHNSAVKDLVERLVIGSGPVRCACLDALLALLLDTPMNQRDFGRSKGLDRVADLLKNRNIHEHVRLKAAEFLLLLLGQVLPRSAASGEDSRGSSGDRTGALTVASTQAEVERLLPVKAAAFIIRSTKAGTNDSNRGPEAIQALSRDILERLK